MGQKTIHVDDLTGVETDQGRLVAHKVEYRGKKFSIETTKANAAKLDAYVEGVLSGSNPIPGIGGKKRRSPASTVQTHGLESKTVREWAISKNVTQDNGATVGKSGRLSQGVYNAYKEAHPS